MEEREAVLAKAREMQTVVSTQRAMREAQATDNEYVRLMFLVKFPEAILALTSIRNGLDRDQLDAVHLGSDETIAATDLTGS